MRPVLACGLVVALAQLAGCQQPLVYPGDQLIGDFSFTARRPLLEDAGLDLTPIGGLPICPMEPGKGFESAVREFEFFGIFSRCSGLVDNPACSADGDGGRVYWTALGVSRDAGYDGQYAWLESLAEERWFTACVVDGGTCVTTVTETMRVALLSVSQIYAVGLPPHCPANPLDGGVPVSGIGPDGGVVAPPGFTETATGFDVVRACGELVDIVDASPECGCVKDGGIPSRCVLWYGLDGYR
jgi:hypothetical protein